MALWVSVRLTYRLPHAPAPRLARYLDGAADVRPSAAAAWAEGLAVHPGERDVSNDPDAFLLPALIHDPVGNSMAALRAQLGCQTMLGDGWA